MQISHEIITRNPRDSLLNDTNYPQAEVRVTHNGAQMLVILGTDGWNKDASDLRGGRKVTWGNGISGDSRGYQFRISTNAAMPMTEREWSELMDYINNVWLEIKVEAYKRGYNY